jgi:predicted MFS family arabinose efflux permease
MNMKKIAYISALGILALLTTEFGIIGLIPQIAFNYHISTTAAGQLISLFALVIAIFGPVMTLLTSKLERRRLAMFTFFIFLLSNLLSACHPPFFWLIIYRVLPAFLHPVYFATALGIVAEDPDPVKGRKFMSIVLSGINIAMISTIPLSTYLGTHFQWYSSYILQAIVSSAALLGVYLVFPRNTYRKAASYSGQLRILVKPSYLLASLTVFLTTAAWFATYSYFAQFFISRSLVEGRSLSVIQLVFGLTGVTGNLFIGRYMATNLHRTAMISLLGTVLIAAGFWCTLPFGLIGDMIVLIFWGLLYGPTFIIGSALATEAAPEAVEFSNSVAASVTNLGITFGTVAGGWVIQTYDARNLPAVGALIGVCAIISLVFLMSGFLKNKSPQTDAGQHPL